MNPASRKARILVVDDDPGLLRLLTIRLRAENYDVEAVESAAQALAATSRFRPDLVISDLRMEPVDGIGLLKELQNRWILLTAHGTIPDAVQATQMGAFGFLTKPVDKQELLDQIQRALKISGFNETTEEMAQRHHHAQRDHGRAPGAGTHGGGHRCARADHRRSGTGKELLARAIHKASPRPRARLRGGALRGHSRRAAGHGTVRRRCQHPDARAKARCRPLTAARCCWMA